MHFVWGYSIDKGAKVLKIKSVGSVCSGIEAASVAWAPLGFNFKWFSEIADFPSRVLSFRYPDIQNIGDMNYIPEKILSEMICSPDLICGGTPCQAFSLAGWKNGLLDDRGNLTLKFVDTIEANDAKRTSKGKEQSIVFWENVEGVLTDKTNAFGCFISSLAGLQEIIERKKWPSAGLIQGPKRNVAWRVLDAKYFGVPQQRKRLYLLAGGKDYHPEDVLFEIHKNPTPIFPKGQLVFSKEGCSFEVFREYTDCLYSAYGTKWNGNAAAYNGSLFIVQNNRIRRLSPLEEERLMGFPDNYTNIEGAKRTNRYQAIGNSWAVPVISWLGERIMKSSNNKLDRIQLPKDALFASEGLDYTLFEFGKDYEMLGDLQINCTSIPEFIIPSTMEDIVSSDAPEDIYISPVGCEGILRRKRERNLRINPRLEEVLASISSEMSYEEIEKKSRVQRRGRFSEEKKEKQPSLFDFI